MSRTHTLLAGALVLQVALVAVTWSTNQGAPTIDADPLLEGIELGDITALEVDAKSDDKPRSVKIKRSGDGWIVAGTDDFPADTKKVEEVLEKLVEARIREPIASNKANHNALDVGDRDYNRKVTISAGDKTFSLVVGNAKGTSSHVRFADQDEVYAARGFSAWSLSDTVTSYIDTQYVKVEDPDAVIVKNPSGTITLSKVEGVWKVAELPPDARIDSSRVDAFISSARSLRMARPVGKTVKPEHGLSGTNATIVTLKKGEETTRYTIGAIDDGNRFVKADGNDYVVKAATFSVASLVEQVPDKFIKEDEPEKPAGGPPGGMPGGMPGMPPGMAFPGMPQ